MSPFPPYVNAYRIEAQWKDGEREKLLGAKGIATRAPGRTTRNKVCY